MTETVSNQLRGMLAYTGENKDIIPLKQLLVTDMNLPISDDDLQAQAAGLIGAAFKPIFPGIEIDIRKMGEGLMLKGFKRTGPRPAPTARPAGSDASPSSWGRLKQKVQAIGTDLKEKAEACSPDLEYLERWAKLAKRKVEHRAEGLNIKMQEFYESYVREFGVPPE
jgi:hypothetical protein